jgi:hypothetical protein
VEDDAQTARRTSISSASLAAAVLGLLVTCRAVLAAESFPIKRPDEGGYVVVLRHPTGPP